MNDLQIIVPNLHFIYEHWFEEFRNDVIKNYKRACRIYQVEGIVTFEEMVDLSIEWLYQVCSQEEYDDRKYYENFILTEYQEEGDLFYDDCHANNESDFRQDLFVVMKDINLSFYTSDGGYHNIPMKGVW